MITITSYQTLGADRAENSIEPAQIFKIRIPDKDIISLDFNNEEYALLFRAQQQETSPRLMIRIINMLMDKIDRQNVLVAKETLAKKEYRNLDELYVDHLVDHLEHYSIASILVLLAKYCGWEAILNYVQIYMESKNG